jgi:hypothetical protein
MPRAPRLPTYCQLSSSAATVQLPGTVRIHGRPEPRGRRRSRCALGLRHAVARFIGRESRSCPTDDETKTKPGDAGRRAPPQDGTRTNDLPVLSFADTHAWSRWLASHHASSPGVWIKIGKKGSRSKSVTYAGALEEVRRHAGSAREAAPVETTATWGTDMSSTRIRCHIKTPRAAVYRTLLDTTPRSATTQSHCGRTAGAEFVGLPASDCSANAVRFERWPVHLTHRIHRGSDPASS